MKHETRLDENEEPQHRVSRETDSAPGFRGIPAIGLVHQISQTLCQLDICGDFEVDGEAYCKEPEGKQKMGHLPNK